MLSKRLRGNSSLKPEAPKNRAIGLNMISRSWDEHNMCNNHILKSYRLRLGVAIPEGNTKMLGRRWRNAAWNWHWHADTEVFSLYWVLLLRHYGAIDCKTRHIHVVAGVMGSCPFQAALAKRRACSKGPVIKSNKDWAATSWSFEPLWGVQLRNLLFLWDCLNSRKQSKRSMAFCTMIWFKL